MVSMGGGERRGEGRGILLRRAAAAPRSRVGRHENNEERKKDDGGEHGGTYIDSTNEGARCGQRSFVGVCPFWRG